MELVKYRAVIISVLKGGEGAECRKREMTLKGGVEGHSQPRGAGEGGR